MYFKTVVKVLKRQLLYQGNMLYFSMLFVD